MNKKNGVVVKLDLHVGQAKPIFFIILFDSN